MIEHLRQDVVAGIVAAEEVDQAGPLEGGATEFSRAEGFREAVDKAFASYRDTLSDDRKALLDRYRLVDVAMKVVGIGSVGRYCSIGLLMSSSNQRWMPRARKTRQA